MRPDIATIESILAEAIEPTTGMALGELETVQSVVVDDAGKVDIDLCLGFACEGTHEALAEGIWRSLSSVAGVEDVAVEITTDIPPGPRATDLPNLNDVKHVIAIASGKGGVGKSTTTVNLALALAEEGAMVGILDADIYGPSQPHLLGVGEERPRSDGQRFFPIAAHGLKVMSMGFLVTENTPMVWRGPMAAGALQQMLGQTAWGELDYLLVDMPPGTGDIQLTLAQKVPLSGALIVTTPQDIALLDARKGIEMFQKVNVPVLGVVENMSTHICSNCGHEEAIFGSGGGTSVALDYQTELLGSLPLTLDIRVDADAGRPSLVVDPESAISQRYREIARKLGARLWRYNMVPPPVIEISED
ncbi:iron-sulfur cluster carrier protein ApbC [Halioxenophilus sp. WMMB6]|uniref:iron-sulfur cluster carrier protein ApbC n=1 Tax=Halioxenophilus sp. WMMB6 TaxID=3073815 RepID=UPI00295ECE7D|nr:iron-sulfur cluster carrier protein ApbC [Halioxenophilus sp. WMMB6]